MKKYNWWILAFTFFFFSCDDNKQAKEIEYEVSELEQGEFIDLDLTDIPSDFLFSQPQQIDFISDSLLVIFDTKPSNGRLCNLFLKNGKLVGSFGMIGNGHGEMIYPERISVGDDNQSIYFFDWRTSFSVKFKVKDVLDGNNEAFIINPLDSLKVVDKQFGSIISFNDRDYIAIGYDGDMRLMWVKNNQKMDVYAQYPSLDENEEYTWDLWTNSAWAKTGVSPNHKYLVNTTRIGMLFEIFELNNGEIESKVLKAFYKPEFGVAEGAQPACVTWCEKTTGGFCALYCTDKGFWGVMDGPGFTHHNEIYEFNYSGDLLNKYKVKGDVVCLAVNAEDEMYLIMMDKVGEQHLMKADLKSVSRKRAV